MTITAPALQMKVHEVHKTIPAKGWVATFLNDRDPVPVISWVYASVTFHGDGQDYPELWDRWIGLGVFPDGPQFIEGFSNFDQYDREEDIT